MHLRLNYPADIELLLLHKRLGSRFPAFVKKCLHAQIDGTDFSYDPPVCDRHELNRFSKSCIVNLAFDPKSDVSIISFLSNFPKNGRSEVIRKMICACSTSFPVNLYLMTAGQEIVEKKNKHEKEEKEKQENIKRSDEKISSKFFKKNEKIENKSDRKQKKDRKQNNEDENMHMENNKHMQNAEQVRQNNKQDDARHGKDLNDDDMMSLLNGIVNHK